METIQELTTDLGYISIAAGDPETFNNEDILERDFPYYAVLDSLHHIVGTGDTKEEALRSFYHKILSIVTKEMGKII
jgi:hypothetical protein